MPHITLAVAFSKVSSAIVKGSVPIFPPTDEKRKTATPVKTRPIMSPIHIAFVFGFLNVIKIRKKATTRVTMLRSTKSNPRIVNGERKRKGTKKTTQANSKSSEEQHVKSLSIPEALVVD